MSPLRKEDFCDDDQAEGGSNRSDAPAIGDAPDETMASGDADRRRGMAERLRDALRDDANGDLLGERGGEENGVLQWLRALDLQAVGACRADERLKPLLKLNVSSGAAEDRLLVQLSQHFEVSEVGMLARCLCVPLVSIRVGKISKQGSLLCPTSIRGYLNLSLLPSSNMRISFTGDDGSIERLAVLVSDLESSVAAIEEISADTSGRSFILKFEGSPVFFFWCSEKSKLHGMELIAKMKDLLSRKPTLSYLTGISESRLDSFGTHLRAYILGSANSTETTSTAASVMAPHASDSVFQASSKPSRVRLVASHATKVQGFYQGSLSPRSNTFKDGALRSSSSNRNVAREKIRRRGDGSSRQLVTCVSSSLATHAPSVSKCEDVKSVTSVSSSENHFSPSHCLPENRGISLPLPSVASVVNSYTPQVTISSPPTSSYYCWCPPYPPSPLHYTMSSSQLPLPSPVSLPLPPLSSFLFSGGPPVPSIPLSSVDELPGINLPSRLPDTPLCFPLPVSSRLTVPISQQIPVFTPFMSDPIVHIPVIDICSAGQGYLVSAEPSISSAISPLLPSRLSETESAVEKGARETLRMLMASSSSSSTAGPQFMGMLPDVISKTDESFPCAFTSIHGAVVGGSRGLYAGTMDVNSVATGLPFKELPFLKRLLSRDCGSRSEECSDLDDAMPQSQLSERCPPFTEGDDLLDRQDS